MALFKKNDVADDEVPYINVLGGVDLASDDGELLVLYHRLERNEPFVLAPIGSRHNYEDNS